MPAMNTPGVKALDIWDVLVAQIITPASIGELLDDYTIQFTPYTYSGLIANLATYVPAAKTLVMVAYLTNGLTGGDLQVMHGATRVRESVGGESGVVAIVYCDGTDIGFKNNSGAQETLTLYGVTMA